MPKKINHDTDLHIKLSAELKAYYADLAVKKGLTLSQFLRLVLENYKNILDNT